MKNQLPTNSSNKVPEKLKELIKKHRITQAKMAHFKQAELETRKQIADELFRVQDHGKKKINVSQVLGESIDYDLVMEIDKPLNTTLDKKEFEKIESQLETEAELALITYHPKLSESKVKWDALEKDAILRKALVSKTGTPTIKYVAKPVEVKK